MVAVASSLAATVLGTMVGILLSRFEFRGKEPPDGARDPAADRAVRRPRGGDADPVHRVWHQASMAPSSSATRSSALPYTTLIVLARLVGSEPQLEDAAMDLGATYPGTLRLVVLPMAAAGDRLRLDHRVHGVVRRVRASHCSSRGRDQTFPVYLYGQLRFASSLPVLIAARPSADGRHADADPVADRIRKR